MRAAVDVLLTAAKLYYQAGKGLKARNAVEEAWRVLFLPPRATLMGLGELLAPGGKVRPRHFPSFRDTSHLVHPRATAPPHRILTYHPTPALRAGGARPPAHRHPPPGANLGRVAVFRSLRVGLSGNP